MPDSFYVGGGVAESVASPVANALFLVAFVFILLLPRKYVIVPVLLAVFLIPSGEVHVIAGFHLMPLRVIALFGWVRLAGVKIFSSEKPFRGRLNIIDKAFLGYALAHALALILLWRTMAAVNNQFGFLWSVLGMYFLLRYLIQDQTDIYIAIKVFALIAFINALDMVHEKYGDVNLFGVLIGGVDPVPLFRDGAIRSQGSFGHPILAGSYAATVLPLFLLLWKNHKTSILAVAGILASAAMVYTCASSTPALAVGAGVLALFFWPLRKQMRIVRWGIVAFLVVAQIFMHAPVWFLIAHMDVIGASSGWHRAELVDVFIRHFTDWCFFGTKDNGNWGFEMFDVSNNYVSVGESGGFLAFWFFIAVIARSFGRLGKARKAVEGDRKQEWVMWLLGAAVFANVIAFFGITYWDQTEVCWYALLAMISAVTGPILLGNLVQDPQTSGELTNPRVMDQAGSFPDPVVSRVVRS